MVATLKPFTDLTAADLMSRDVVTVPCHIPVPEAARILARADVSGAPVVDDRGVLVGVISATDFLRRTGGETGRFECSGECACSDWEMVDETDLPPEEVAAYMTTDLVTAAPGAPVALVTRMMIDAHIHRVIVVDDRFRPVGIVTSTDVLAAVARGDTL